jgi:HlyD family secretion protein
MRKLSGVMVLGLCAFVTLNLTACGSSKSNAVPTLITTTNVKRDTVKVKKGNIIRTLSCKGQVISVTSRNLSFDDTDGYLEKLNVKVGSVVKQGDIIAELDTKDIEYQIKQEQIKMQMAQLDYNEAVKNKATSFDIKRAQLNLDAENITMNKLKENEDNMVLRAGMSGVITSLNNLKIYQHIEPFEILGVISDPSAYQVQYKGLNKKLAVGTKVDITVQDTHNIFQDVEQGEVISNVIDKENPNTDSVITIKFDKQPKEAQLDDEADIEYVDEKVTNVLFLPIEAVKNGAEQHPYVRIIKNGEVSEKYIETGISDSKYIEIVSGLALDDEVITF